MIIIYFFEIRIYLFLLYNNFLMSESKPTNWKEWIQKRFEDNSMYIIEYNSIEAEYYIRSTNPIIKTKIIFVFMSDDDDDVLYDIHFKGDDSLNCNQWFSHFTTDSELKPDIMDQWGARGTLLTSLFFNENFVYRLENEWLKIPLKTGWTEEVLYVRGKIYRAKLKIHPKIFDGWYLNHSIPFNLNFFDKLRIFLEVGLSKEQFTFKPIE